MICPKCHTVNDEEEKYCKECGFQLNSARICPTCGKTNDSNSKYCKECGTVLTPVNTFRKQVIEENTKKSFFSMYKVPIICALAILLAIGAVTGMAYYNGGSGGDDGFSTIIPTDDNGFFNEDVSDSTQAQMQEEENKTNETTNQTNDTNESKTLTEKVENKTNNTNTSKTLTEKVENKTNKTKNLTSTVNKTKDKTNSSKTINSSSSKNKTSKTITEKVNKSEANKNKNNKNSPSSSNNSGNAIIPGIIGNNSDDDLDDSVNDSLDDLNDSEDILDNDTDDLNESLNDTEDNDTEELEDSTEIEMEDVPNLAKLVSEKNYEFSTIEYNGNEYTEAQCIDIFAEYLLNIDKNKDSAIEINDIEDASNPSGEDLSQSIEESDYLSMAQRVHSWVDQKDTVPNYVGISGVGAADLSPKMMLKLFTLATLNYSITGELPESVEI